MYTALMYIIDIKNEARYSFTCGLILCLQKGFIERRHSLRLSPRDGIASCGS